MKCHSELPDPIFNYILECESAGYYPSFDEIRDHFGDEAVDKYGGNFPDVSYNIEEEFADEEFLGSPLTENERMMKYAGHKLLDFE